MPIVDKNRLKGNHGASLVASWLGRKCLVRPVAADTDVGIDLFCETVDQRSRQPCLHFWVQVRSGKQVAVKDGKAKCKFANDHILYWARQPVPVYAFLIPEGTSGLDISCVYMISVVRYAAINGLPPSATGESTLESAIHVIRNDQDLDPNGEPWCRIIEDIETERDRLM